MHMLVGGRLGEVVHTISAKEVPRTLARIQGPKRAEFLLPFGKFRSCSSLPGLLLVAGLVVAFRISKKEAKKRWAVFPLTAGSFGGLSPDRLRGGPGRP